MAGQMIQMLTFHTRDDVLRFLQHHIPLPQLRTQPMPFRTFDHMKPEVLAHQAGSHSQQSQQHAAMRDSVGSPAAEQTPGIPVTPETTQKAKKGTTFPCAACKQKHVKCTHGIAKANNDHGSVQQPQLTAAPGGQTFSHHDPEVGSSGGDAQWVLSAHQEMLRQQAITQANVGMGYGRTSYQGVAQHHATGDIFTSQGYQQMELPTASGNYFHHHSTPSQMWSGNTTGGDLNALAAAAEQVTSHAAQTEQTFKPYSVHAGATPHADEQYNQETAPTEQPMEQYHNAMDFSHLLNSDAASGPTPENEQPEQRNPDAQLAGEVPSSGEHEIPIEEDEHTQQLNSELQNATEIEAKPKKKQSRRKKSEYLPL